MQQKHASITLRDTIYLDLPASTKYLNVLGAALEEVLSRSDSPVAQQVIHAVKLAVHEACTNIVLHAYHENSSGRLEITIRLYDDRLVIMLHDTGKAFNPEAQPEPALGTAQVHGFGLFLMRNLLDEVMYHTNSTGNHWYLAKRL